MQVQQAPPVSLLLPVLVLVLALVLLGISALRARAHPVSQRALALEPGSMLLAM
jgi:hypothetical protein